MSEPVRFTVREKKIGQYSLNKIYSGRHPRLRMQDANYWRVLVRNELQKQKIPKKIMREPVKISFGWPGRLDLDNYAYIRKMIIDALKGWVLEDDGQKFVAELYEILIKGDVITVQVEAAERRTN